MTITRYYYYYPDMKKSSTLFFVILLFFSVSALHAQIDIDLKDLLSESRLVAINKFLIRDESVELLKQNASIIDLSNYVMTPGDIYILTIASGIDFDKTKISKLDYPMILSSDYKLNVPVLNEIDVKGMTIRDVERYIDKKLQEKNVVYQFLTLQLKVPAQFDVIVHGEVNLPGIKPSTPELTLTDILTLSGGLTPNGSYRSIALTRNNTVYYYDISAFFFEGDLTQNPKLQPGDRVYVAQSKSNVAIFGEIRNPGIYEMLPGESLNYLLQHSGYSTDMMPADYLEISRRDQLLHVNVTDAENFFPENEDKIYFPKKDETMHSIIVEGAIMQGKKSSKSRNPADKLNVLHFHTGMTLLSVLVNVGGPTPIADMNRCVIQRKNPPETVDVDLNKLWGERKTEFDVMLKPGDYVYIPTDTVVMPIFVAGQVNKPGIIDFMPGLTVGDYIMFSGGFDVDSANPNALFFFDAQGNKEKTSLDTIVFPGQNILVDKNPIDKADDYMSKFFIITGWIAILTSLTSDIVEIVVALKE